MSISEKSESMEKQSLRVKILEWQSGALKSGTKATIRYANFGQRTIAVLRKDQPKQHIVLGAHLASSQHSIGIWFGPRKKLIIGILNIGRK